VGAFVADSYSPVRLADNPRLSRRKLQVVRLVDAATARIPAQFIAVSETIKEANCGYLRLPPRKVAVVQRGRDLARYDDRSTGVDPREHVGSLIRRVLSGPVILTVGRLIHEKGQRHLVAAMREVVAMSPGAVLLVAGEGVLRSELEGLIARLDLNESVFLLGHRADVPELLQAADVFALPSLLEGAAGAVVEAMMAGKPVVASDLPSVRECVADAGAALLVPPGDPAALASAVISLLTDPKRRAEMGQSAAVAARARYALRDKAEATCEVFRVATVGRSGRRARA
jgi:glycosyltransferase involved in cell wall biosynthesis